VSDNLRSILKRAQGSKESVAFSKLLTAVEKAGPKALQIDDLLQPKHTAFRIGITGPPGAGKSTLISHLLKNFSAQKLRVGVLAVDPTSPFSSGAILGDRIRYTNEIITDNIFVRSLGSRGSLGGLSASVYLMLRAFDACNFDVVIVETIGVGQVEIDIMNVADHVVLVLVPESGDSIQVMKAGIIEIANTIVVNKSDRPGADALKREVEAQMALVDDQSVSVFSVSALEGSGIEKLQFEMNRYIDAGVARGARNDPSRIRAEAQALKRSQLETKAAAWARGIKNPADLKRAVSKIT
jgi:LAO/AO transport system kinase